MEDEKETFKFSESKAAERRNTINSSSKLSTIQSVNRKENKEEQKRIVMPILPPAVSPKQRCFSPQPEITSFINPPVEINIKTDLKEFSNIKGMLRDIRNAKIKIIAPKLKERVESSFVDRGLSPIQMQRPSKKLDEIRNISKQRNRSHSRNQTISLSKKISFIASSTLQKRVSNGRTTGDFLKHSRNNNQHGNSYHHRSVSGCHFEIR